MDDADLLRRLRMGDQEAWDSLFSTYSERVWRYVARLIGARPECVADVVQETFFAVMRSCDQFDPGRGTLWAWMAGIAHNRSMSWWRGQRRQTAALSAAFRQAAYEGPLARWFAADATPGAMLEDRETADLVRQVLGELPAEYAVCLISKYVDELSAMQIAQTLGESEDAVRSRLSRARTAFRELFSRRMQEL